nr:PREDICTED: uncharacterized protein C2orf82 homolog [Stegastes partitus]
MAPVVTADIFLFEVRCFPLLYRKDLCDVTRSAAAQPFPPLTPDYVVLEWPATFPSPYSSYSLRRVKSLGRSRTLEDFLETLILRSSHDGSQFVHGGPAGALQPLGGLRAHSAQPVPGLGLAGCYWLQPAALRDRTSCLLCPRLKASLMAELAAGLGLQTCSQLQNRKRRTAPSQHSETARDNQDTMSGEPPSDVTTRVPFRDMTEQSFTYDYEDATHSNALDEEGVLGPGAITAIVIAVFLGASVLIALICIALQKFTAS